MKSSSQTVVTYLRSLVARQGTEENDCELLRRFGEAHDADAFAVLMQRHGPIVLDVARRVSGDEQLAEDVFQAAFLLLARKAHTIRRPESLPCWLHGVARRLALQGRRERQRRHQRETQVQPTFPPSPLDELTAREFLAILDDELRQLRESYRAPLILCCLEGLPREEAAKRLGCSPDALKGRLERGRERLRLRLEKRGLTLPAVLGATTFLTGSRNPVRAALVQATLQNAISGDCVNPAIAALIKGAMRTMFLHNLRLAGAALVLVGAAAGLGMVIQQEKEQAEQPSLSVMLPENPAQQGDHKDLYGDPLPQGAIMRLGTLQRRAVGAQLAVSSDGESIIGVRGQRYIHIWDAATGKLRQTRELAPSDGYSYLALSWEGKRLATNREAEGREKLTIWDVPTGKKIQTLGIEGARFIPLMAFSRDGKKIAAIGHLQGRDNRHDDLIRVWDLASGKEIFRKEVPNNNQSYLLAFSPDGEQLLASFNNAQGTYCCCWDISNGKQLWQNANNIWHLAMVFTADGKVLAAQQPAPKPLAVDLATGRAAPIENPPPIDYDTRLAGTPDGRTLLISTAKGVIVWDMVNGQELRTLQGAGEQVVVMPDSKSIITNDGVLERWDLKTGKRLWTDTFALGHSGEVVRMAFSADGKRLASVATDGSVRLWDVLTGKPLRSWRGHLPQRWLQYLPEADGAKAVDITPDGRYVLSGGSDEQLKLWDAASEKEVRSIPLPVREDGEDRRYLFHVRISSDGSRAVALFGARGFYFVSGQPANRPAHKLATWDLKSGELLTCHPVELSDGRFSTISPDGRLLLNKGILVDVATGKKIAQLEGKVSAPCEFARDGALVVGSCTRTVQKNGVSYETADGLRVWETATGKAISHLKTDPWMGQVIFHPDNRFILTSDFNGIRLWDTNTGKLMLSRKMPESIPSSSARLGYTASLDFTADGRRLATGLPDSTILLWDIPPLPRETEKWTGKELEALWADLADADAARTWRAVWRMADARDALAFLRGRVKPHPIAAEDVMRKLLADLDSDLFEEREAAAKRLKVLGLQAEPALRAALGAKLSLEQRRRIESILGAMSEPEKPAPEELRQLRALIVLERIGTPEARRLLEEAAKGPPSARLTRQALSSLACIR